MAKKILSFSGDNTYSLEKFVLNKAIQKVELIDLTSEAFIFKSNLINQVGQ